MKLKKTVLWAAVLGLLFSVIPSAYAVDHTEKYIYTITTEKSEVQTGEEFAVSVELAKSDGESFPMYAVSGALRFHSGMLELIQKEEKNGVTAVAVPLTGTLEGWEEIHFNAVASTVDDVDSWSSPTQLMTLHFSPEKSGYTTLQIVNGSVSNYSGSDSFEVSSESVGISISAPISREQESADTSETSQDSSTSSDNKKTNAAASSGGGGGGGSVSAGSQEKNADEGTQSEKKNPEETQVVAAPEENNPDTKASLPASQRFTDIPSGIWYESAVSSALDAGWLQGTGEHLFSPDADMTRAMLITVLARMDGVDTEGGSTWYEKGVNWAKENGISDGSALTESITREQLVTMLARYAQKKGISLEKDGDLTSYDDRDQISPWASEAFVWAVKSGILQGTGAQQLSPQMCASRAQVAVLLMRFQQFIS